MAADKYSKRVSGRCKGSKLLRYRNRCSGLGTCRRRIESRKKLVGNKYYTGEWQKLGVIDREL